jgi:hypothetical protein
LIPRDKWPGAAGITLSACCMHALIKCGPSPSAPNKCVHAFRRSRIHPEEWSADPGKLDEAQPRSSSKARRGSSGRRGRPARRSRSHRRGSAAGRAASWRRSRSRSPPSPPRSGRQRLVAASGAPDAVEHHRETHVLHHPAVAAAARLARSHGRGGCSGRDRRRARPHRRPWVCAPAGGRARLLLIHINSA